MALQIANNVESPIPYSSQQSFTNPLVLSCDGRVGAVLEYRLYLYNDSVSHSYADISIEIDQLDEEVDLTGGTQGFSLKLKAGDTNPSEEEWKTIAAANSIELPDISDTITFLPFWVRMEVPANVPVRKFRDITLSIVAMEATI